ncbi:hypothetical protein EOD39_14366 [Acipenser ruthenus]|uniref:Uncharacterized protein n=1 Tax=Acipenser ruthenus TaxID=7906 RepID=A0A662YLN9_ACIRT|nr:hypothetical protein EOD39_14366 [Acipenser ruthenus]
MQTLDPLEMQTLDPLEMQMLDPLEMQMLDPPDTDMQMLDPPDVWLTFAVLPAERVLLMNFSAEFSYGFIRPFTGVAIQFTT